MEKNMFFVIPEMPFKRFVMVLKKTSWSLSLKHSHYFSSSCHLQSSLCCNFSLTTTQYRIVESISVVHYLQNIFRENDLCSCCCNRWLEDSLCSPTIKIILTFYIGIANNWFCIRLFNGIGCDLMNANLYLYLVLIKFITKIMYIKNLGTI